MLAGAQFPPGAVDPGRGITRSINSIDVDVRRVARGEAPIPFASRYSLQAIEVYPLGLEQARVCVCVCVCVRERERERASACGGRPGACLTLRACA